MENFKHHLDCNSATEHSKEVTSVYEEEVKYKQNTEIFVSKNTKGGVLGFIRVLRWNYQDKLPIENIFGIKPLEITGTSPLKAIWHIGKFAISKEVKDIESK